MCYNLHVKKREVEEIKYRLKELRTNAKLSQTELSKMSGVCRRAIIHIEEGKANPTVKTLEQICNVLNVDVPEIFAKDVSYNLQNKF